MPTKAAPVAAQEVRATAAHLEIITDQARFEIPWRECSDRLAQAPKSGRPHLALSPSGYGIHWPLIDEDLAVGPLVRSRKPRRA